jgi:hypothetical protein
MPLHSRNKSTYLLMTFFVVLNNLSLFKDKSHKTSFFLSIVIPLYTTGVANKTSFGSRILRENSDKNFAYNELKYIFSYLIAFLLLFIELQ